MNEPKESPSPAPRGVAALLAPVIAPAGVCVSLAALPSNAHIDTRGLAGALGVCIKSVERMTRRGELPQPFRLSGRNTWMVSTILEHFQNRQREALSKQSAHGRRLAQASA